MSLNQTPLFNLHQQYDARLTAFAGYDMPLQYSGIKQEHLHTRSQASLFDISHMGFYLLTGNDAAIVLEKLVPSDIQNLPINQQRYTVLLNAEGGVVDDLMVTKTKKGLLLVLNAACKEKDEHYLRKHLPGDCTLLEITDHALLALQGPTAVNVLARHNPDIQSLSFLTGNSFQLLENECFISRCGYTGEDGFELMVPIESCEEIAETLLEHETVEFAGLGARDTLRLEAGLCLYGHELDEQTSPVTAGLTWTISKRRLLDDDFMGKKIIKQELESGTTQSRCGLMINGRVPVREGAELFDDKDRAIGCVTSGGYSPSLEIPIAMAQVDRQYTKPGTLLQARVRDKKTTLRVVPLPFIPHHYYQ